METLHKCLALLMGEPNYSISGKSGWLIPGTKKGNQKNIRLFAWCDHLGLLKKMDDSIFWFHSLVNIHLVILLVIGIFIEVPPSHAGLYYWVCIAAGWLFFFTTNWWVSGIMNRHGKKWFLALSTEWSGLYALAGYNWKTRFGLLFLLSFSIIISLAAHPSFALITGFCIRWLAESILLEFLALPGRQPVKKGRIRQS